MRGLVYSSLIEDWLVPEETSCRKLIDKSLQAVSLLIGLSKLGETARRNMLTPRLKDALNTRPWGGWGCNAGPYNNKYGLLFERATGAKN